jgi:hypothetical protein
MTGLAAPSGVTPMDLQTVAAVIVVALVVALAFVVVYSVVAGGLASLLVLFVGLVRLFLSGIVSAFSAVRRHLRTRGLTPEAVPDLRVRPSG